MRLELANLTGLVTMESKWTFKINCKSLKECLKYIVLANIGVFCFYPSFTLQKELPKQIFLFAC
jgi:hypothetical protein